MPQSRHPTVTIGKRMDEYEFIVKNCSKDQRMNRIFA